MRETTKKKKKRKESQTALTAKTHTCSLFSLFATKEQLSTIQKVKSKNLNSGSTADVNN